MRRWVLVLAVGCGDHSSPPMDAPFPMLCDGGSGTATATPTILPVSSAFRDTEPRVVRWGQQVLVGWQSETVIAFNFASSPDAIQPWSTLPTVPAKQGVAGDVSLTTDAAGAVHLVGIQVLGNDQTSTDVGPLLAATLPAGAAQFDPAFELSQTKQADKPSVAIDASGREVILYDDLSASQMFTRATDATATAFTTPAALTYSDGTVFGGDHPIFCIDKTGRAPTPLRAVAGPVVAILRESGDALTPDVSLPVSYSPVSQDSACVIDGDELWIANAASDAQLRPRPPEVTLEIDPADFIHVLHSSDGGLSFDRDVRITGPTSTTKYAFPEMVRTPSGQLELAYYAGVPDQAMTLMRATSSDGDCATWSTQPLAHNGSLRVSRLATDWIGDYFGIVALDHAIVVAYVDNGQTCAIGSGPCGQITTAQYAVP